MARPSRVCWPARRTRSHRARGGKSSSPAVSARDPGKERDADLTGCEFFADPVALAASPKIDLFVELIGGAEGPARTSVETALAHGKSVVTANKALLAAHGLELAALAEEKHVALAFEASVAGGIPIVKTLREGLAGNSIDRVYGILNGTCNYILSRMEREQLSFEECLAEAQKLGYAEADPTFDIGGFDTAHKLSILTSLAFGVRIAPEAIEIEGIERVSLADIAAEADKYAPSRNPPKRLARNLPTAVLYMWSPKASAAPHRDTRRDKAPGARRDSPSSGSIPADR